MAPRCPFSFSGSFAPKGLIRPSLGKSMPIGQMRPPSRCKLGKKRQKEVGLRAARIKQQKIVCKKRRSLRAMPFLHFADHLARTWEVFPQGHRKGAPICHMLLPQQK